jgi:hypothetical protein
LGKSNVIQDKGNRKSIDEIDIKALIYSLGDNFFLLTP